MLSQASIRPSGEYAGEIFVRHLQSVNCAMFLKRMKQIGKDMAAAQQELSQDVLAYRGTASHGDKTTEAVILSAAWWQVILGGRF